jgi:putative transposase
MPTFTQIYYHIVFSTKNRRPVLTEAHQPQLYGYLWALLENKKCHPYQIGGVEDHIHIYTSLHPQMNLSSLVKDMKPATSDMIKKERLFRAFDYWQDGYGAFTHSWAEKSQMIQYVANQKEHHTRITFREELKQLLLANGVAFEEKYLD